MIQEILKGIPDKRKYKETTSLKFKEDVYNAFKEIGQEYTCLEVGTNHGHTTRILSFIFNHVITIDHREEPPGIDQNHEDILRSKKSTWKLNTAFSKLRL